MGLEGSALGFVFFLLLDTRRTRGSQLLPLLAWQTWLEGCRVRQTLGRGGCILKLRYVAESIGHVGLSRGQHHRTALPTLVLRLLQDLVPASYRCHWRPFQPLSASSRSNQVTAFDFCLLQLPSRATSWVCETGSPPIGVYMYK